jgi:hypothetical protein
MYYDHRQVVAVLFSCSCIILHFAPHALHILISTIFMHIRVDHVEPKTEIQVEQV